MWRELGFNTCAKRPCDYWRFESLPDWAQRTLTEHAEDPRQYTYDFKALESANTHDPLWNAAQREMLPEGWMHNYMRMLLGQREPGVVPIAAAGARDDDGPDESMGARRARSELLRGLRVDAGQIRSAVAGASGLRNGPFDELGECGAEAAVSRYLAANSPSDRSDRTKRKRPVR